MVSVVPKPLIRLEYVAVDSRSAALKPKMLDYAASAVLPFISRSG